MDLSGVWKYKKDPGDNLEAGSLKDFSQWEEMAIPNNWYLAGLEYAGTVWFYREFGFKLKKNSGRHILKFHGVDYYAEVWLNDKKVGDHEGYFQPFEFDVTDILEEGKNSLLVKVSSPKEEPDEIWPSKKFLIKGIFNHHDARPGSWDQKRGQEKNTGGIWNRVELKTRPEKRISGLRVAPRLMGNGASLVRVKVNCNNSGSSCEAALVINISPHNFDGQPITREYPVNLPAGENMVEKTIILEDPKLWWTWDHGDQNLYQCQVTLKAGEGIDKKSDIFGIREIQMAGKDANSRWKLNGQSFFPRGSNIIPTQWLAEYDRRMIDKDIKLIKEANLNTIRVHAHVNRDEFYRACDQAGILVWQDFSLQWSYEETESFYNKAAGQIRDMVRHLYNHPSIGIWCPHNEPSVNEGTLDNLLFDTVKEEDSSRHIEHHSDFSDHPYPGWYWDSYLRFELLPGAPFVNEFGAQALPCVEHLREMFDDPDHGWPPNWDEYAFHDFQYDQTFNVAGIDLGDSLEEFVQNSQQYQYDLLKFAIETYRKNKYDPMVGVIQFMFVDCWPSITWSVLDYERTPKKGYEALKLGMQPVLPIFEIARRKLQPGGRAFPIFSNLYIINDLHKDFEGAAVEIWLEASSGKKVIQGEIEVDIPPDGKVMAMEAKRGDEKWALPANSAPGHYQLKASINYREEVIGENVEVIEVLPPKGKHLTIDL